MKTTFFLAFMVLAHVVNAQHEYIKIYTMQAGIEQKDKAKFVYPDHPDSANLYNALKLQDIGLGIELMESKGFELLSITPMVVDPGLIVTFAYMRRKTKLIAKL